MAPLFYRTNFVTFSLFNYNFPKSWHQNYSKSFHSQEWSISNFSCSLTRNIALHSTKSFSYLTQMEDDCATNSHYLTYTFLFKRLGEGTFWKGQPFHSQDWSMSNFPCSLTGNITSHSMENFTFHSLLRWKMIVLLILTTSLIHSSLKGWENLPSS